MGDIEEFSQLCRLCLVKEEVNVPIFDESSDIRQTFLKISSCLPVKVSPEDNLPKKICDGCSYKLDMLYVFRNTSVDSEKQLLSWLDQAGLDGETVKDGLGAKAEVMVKQEAFEPIDTRIEDGEEGSDIGVDAQSYIIQQQQLSYEQDFSYGEEDEPTDPTVDPIATDEPAPKRAKRNASKRPVLDETEDELDSALHITKAEDDDEDVDQHDYLEATEAPSTSADDQPGPSGVGKGTVEAPFLNHSHIASGTKPKIRMKMECDHILVAARYRCDICKKRFNNSQKLKDHRQDVHCIKITCHVCGKSFLTEQALKTHYEDFKHRKNESQSVENLTCKTCLDTFATEADLQLHVEKHHYGRHCYRTARLPKRKRQVSCFLLDKDTLHADRHYTPVVPEFRCEDCNNVFFSKSVLDAHIKNAHFVHPCHVCKAIFTNKPNLKSHLSMHQPKTWLCATCGKCFRHKISLTAHMNTHSEEMSYLCSYCRKPFRSLSYLKQHRKTHTQKMSRTRMCEYCGQRFYKGSRLIAHIKNRHRSERPLVCMICNKQFALKEGLKKHMRKHHKVITKKT